MKTKVYFFFLMLLLLLSCTTAVDKKSDLFVQFKEPPTSAKPKGLWTWLNGNFDHMSITRELEAAKEKGLSGFDIWDVGMLVDPDSVVPAGPPFLSDSSLAAIAFALQEASRLDLEMGLVLSSSWNAGGHWIPPEHGAMGLFRSTLEVQGPKRIDQKLQFPELPQMDDKKRHESLIEYGEDGLPTYYKEVAVLGIPVSTDSLIADTSYIMDLSVYVDDMGHLQWDVPSGDWIVTRYVCTGTGQPLAIPSKKSMGRMLDHFSKDAMQFNLDYIFTKLETVVDDLANSSLQYLYTDSYEVNTAVWTPELPEYFSERNGYSLIKYLPILDGFRIADDNTSEAFHYDLSKLLSNLIIENHYQYATTYCESKGVGFSAEAGGPGPPVHNVPFEDLKALGSLSVPRGEFWLEHPRGKKHQEELQIVKGIASAAHLYNQPMVEAESFTSVWLWQEGPGDLKPVADRAFCEGLSKIVYHTFPHTPHNAGFPGWVYNFGTLIHLNNVWWEQSEVFHQYLARNSLLLQTGHFKGHVLYYYGDKAPNFVPPKHRLPGLPFGYDYDYVNSDIILNSLEVKGNTLRLPHGSEYDLLVLGGDGRINPKVLHRISELLKNGAWVVGSRPSGGYGLHYNSEEVEIINELPAQLWEACTSLSSKGCTIGRGRLFDSKDLGTILEQKSISPSLRVDKIWEDSIDYIRQVTDQEDIYLIRNKTGQFLQLEVGFYPKNGLPYFLDYDSGETYAYPWGKNEGGFITLQIVLPPHGMHAYTFVNNDSSSANWIDSFQQKATKNPNYLFHQGSWLDFTVSADEIALNDVWTINFSGVQGMDKRIQSKSLFDWTTSNDPEIIHFSGKAIYRNTFNLNRLENKDQALWIQFVGVEEIAKVFINDELAGYLWTPPYGLDIAPFVKQGKNTIRIEVTNLLNNHMVGDYKYKPSDRKTRTNVNKGPNAWMMPWNEVPLKSSGLIGPVNLRWIGVD